MNEVLHNMGVFAAGLVIGTLFFGGLWFTIKKGVSAKIPALWFFFSFMLRVGITLLGFYYVASGSLQSLLICTFGFVVSRFVITYFTKSNDKKQIEPIKITDYEA